MKKIQIKVKPQAKKSLLEILPDGTFKAYLKNPPVDGKANEELTALVAKHFKIPKSGVSIKSGVSGRLKLVTIDTR